jgi:anthranilate phosphoribosyltransferase
MRIKGDTAEELAGIADAMRVRAAPLENRSGRPLVCTGGGYDGCVEVPQLTVAAGVVAAAAGAGVVMHCGSRIGPKHGVVAADVLERLGGDGRPGPAASEAMLERAGVTVVHAAESLRGWEGLGGVRDDVGLRLPVNSAEKLVDWFGAETFIVGYHHGQYAERLCAALAVLGARHAYAVRGVEGSDVVRPGRPVVHLDGVRLELPEQLGDRLAREGGADLSAGLTRAVVEGSAHRVVTSCVVLSAALRLHACELAATVLRGVAQARAAIADGRAAATLEALVG